MAGPIGMAVLAGLKTVVCPHCGKRQARDKHARGPLKCKKCGKPIEMAGATRAMAGATRAKKR